MKKIIIALLVIAAAIAGTIYYLNMQQTSDEVPASDYAQEAEQFLENKQYSRALEQYKLAINADPSNPDMYLSAADIHLLKSQYDEAIDLLKNGETTVTHPDKIHRKMGAILLGQKNYEDASNYIEKSLEENPNNWETVELLIVAYSYQKKELGQAQARVADIEPQEQENKSRKEYYSALLNYSDASAALAYAKEAQQLAENNDFREKVNNLIAIFEARQEEPDDIVTHNTFLAYELMRNDLYTYAIPLIQESIAENDEYYAAYMYLGVCNMKLEQLEDAEKNLSKATTVAPDEVQPWVFLAQVYTIQNNQKKAIDTYESALNVEKDNAIVRHDFARTLIKFGLHRQAKLEYEELLELESNDIYIYQKELVFLLLDHLNEPGEALIYAEDLVNNWNGFSTSDEKVQAELLDALGWAYQKNNQKDNALQYLTQSIETYPYLAITHYHLGVIYAEIGNVSEARIQLERAIDLDLEGDISPLANQKLETLEE